MKNLLLINLSLISVLTTSCLKKDDLRWKLLRNKESDSKQNTKKNQCKYIDCESLPADFYFFVEGSSGGWDVALKGYSGKCFFSKATYSDAMINIKGFQNSDFTLTFWTKSEPSYYGVEQISQIPEITNFGQVLNVSKIKGSKSGWMKIQTSTIKGGYDLKIRFKPNTDLLSYFVDEIEFLCD